MRVPHISLLGLTIADLQILYEAASDECTSVKARKLSRLRKAKMDATSQSSKTRNMDERSHFMQAASTGVADHLDWHAAWTEYVRGLVVSQATSDLIKSFLLHTLATPAAIHGDNGNGNEGVRTGSRFACAVFTRRQATTAYNTS